MAKAENKHTWGLKTAARLRAAHASLPDLSPEERRGYLVEEIETSLDSAATVPGETRQSLLEALQDYFPVFGEEAPAVPTAAVPPPAAPAARRPAEWPLEDLIEELSRRSGQLGAAQMERLSSLLPVPAQQPGSGGAAPCPSVAEAIAFPVSATEIAEFERSVGQLWQELGIPEDSRGALKLYRLLKMLGILSAGFRDIHRFVWAFWGEMAGKDLRSQVAPAFANRLEEAIGSFVTGGEVGGGQFHHEMETTKRVLVSILFGLRKGAEEYGRLHEGRLSPNAVADTVLLEESAADPAKVRDFARKCWDKYSRLAKHQTAETIHDEILRAVAEAACARIKLS
jgi:hypothetical protein